ncbi:hypothetical protein PAMP_005684 [Pampus punctatissimus]
MMKASEGFRNTEACASHCWGVAWTERWRRVDDEMGDSVHSLELLWKGSRRRGDTSRPWRSQSLFDAIFCSRAPLDNALHPVRSRWERSRVAPRPFPQGHPDH